MDRNTKIRGSQFRNLELLPEDIKSTNVLGTGMDGYIPTYDEATGKFTWEAQSDIDIGSSTYSISFTDVSLGTGDVLTVNHNLDFTYPLVVVYDNNGKVIEPDEITYSNSNTVLIDLSSFASLTGTWNVRIVGGTWTQDLIKDEDNDTKIQVEESADEDKIRFDTAGVERMVIDENGHVSIGSGSASRFTPGAGDVFIGGKLEVDNYAYFDSWAVHYSYIIMGDKQAIRFGVGTNDAHMLWETAETTDTLHLLLSSNSRTMIIGEKSHLGKAFDHADTINPTIFIHSVTDPDSDNTQWISFTHDQTDGVIDVGTGDILLKDSLKFDLGTAINEFSTDTTLGDNSDDALPTEKAVKTYVDNNAVPVEMDLNIMLNAFRIAINGSLTKFNMIDGITDEFEDESGIDETTAQSSNHLYNDIDDYYSPTFSSTTELDYMEYSSTSAAQAQWVTSDGYDDAYKLVLHFEGTDGDTSTTDSSPQEHSITFVGGAEIDDQYKKWGNTSCYFGNTGDYLTLADSADWDFCGNASDDWTIHFWVRMQSGMDDWCSILNHYENNSNFWDISIDNYDRIELQMYSGGSLVLRTGAGAGSQITVDTWHHVAVIKVGSNYGIYIDGNQGDHTNDSSTDTFSGLLYIGHNPVNNYDFEGNLDEMIIVKENIFSASPDAGLTDTITVPTSASIENYNCYSESTTKNQGSYSLKCVAQATDSLNDYLESDMGTGGLDLSGKRRIYFDVYAERTGTNLQLQFHDTGGTTSFYDITINSANTWETKIWDISGIADADKNVIDWFRLKVTNADAENTFYIDNMYYVGSPNNMTLISTSTTAEATPDSARIVLFEEDEDTLTLNTDIKAYVSRDGGSTWAQATLSDEGDYEPSKRILTGIADLTASGIGSGTSMEWKVETLNNKGMKLHGVGLLWD